MKKEKHHDHKGQSPVDENEWNGKDERTRRAKRAADAGRSGRVGYSLPPCGSTHSAQGDEATRTIEDARIPEARAGETSRHAAPAGQCAALTADYVRSSFGKSDVRETPARL